MSIPRQHPSMVALTDQELAHVAHLLDRYPSYSTYLAAGYGAREVGRLVAVDLLARLSETADKTKPEQLAILTARLHAWLQVTV